MSIYLEFNSPGDKATAFAKDNEREVAISSEVLGSVQIKEERCNVYAGQEEDPSGEQTTVVKISFMGGSGIKTLEIDGPAARELIRTIRG